MSRFSAPPPNGDSRKMIEQRAREATRPPVPETQGSWPFSANKQPFAVHRDSKPTAHGGDKENPA
ncbi:MAG: hypothetical protein JWR74_3168 [Polaromonas sp.]|jgi:hypothetical protein|nr:hypothetical protein [Polaromonas sp.]